MMFFLQPVDFYQHGPYHCVQQNVKDCWRDRVPMRNSSICYERPCIEPPNFGNTACSSQNICISLYSLYPRPYTCNFICKESRRIFAHPGKSGIGAYVIYPRAAEPYVLQGCFPRPVPQSDTVQYNHYGVCDDVCLLE